MTNGIERNHSSTNLQGYPSKMAEELRTLPFYCGNSSNDEEDFVGREMDDRVHSPTDNSEDSVEVKVSPISGRNKRKCMEPRRVQDAFANGPLKKRMCLQARVAEMEQQRAPFRPWSMQLELEKEYEKQELKPEEKLEMLQFKNNLLASKETMVKSEYLQLQNNGKSKDFLRMKTKEYLKMDNTEFLDNKNRDFLEKENKEFLQKENKEFLQIDKKHVEGKGCISKENEFLRKEEDRLNDDNLYKGKEYLNKSEYLNKKEFLNKNNSFLNKNHESSNRNIEFSNHQNIELLSKQNMDYLNYQNVNYLNKLNMNKQDKDHLNNEVNAYPHQKTKERLLEEDNKQYLGENKQYLLKEEQKQYLEENKQYLLKDEQKEYLLKQKNNQYLLKEEDNKSYVEDNKQYLLKEEYLLKQKNNQYLEEQNKQYLIQDEKKQYYLKKNKEYHLDKNKKETFQIKEEPYSPLLNTHTKFEQAVIPNFVNKSKSTIVSNTPTALAQSNNILAQSYVINEKPFSYFRPPSPVQLSTGSPTQQQPISLVKRLPTVEVIEPRVPIHPQSSKLSTSDTESVIRSSVEAFPKLQNRKDQRNYKNMTRERRIEANARERTRVHTISAAFDTLRKSIPAYSHSQKLSKLSVLRIACGYIATLSNMVNDDHNAVSQCVSSVTSTIQREGKLRKKKDDD